jgi:hypothetical protein
LIRAVQVFRKDLSLDYSDRIELWLGTDSEDVVTVATKHSEWIASETLAVALHAGRAVSQAAQSKMVELEGTVVHLGLTRTGVTH